MPILCVECVQRVVLWNTSYFHIYMYMYKYTERSSEYWHSKRITPHTFSAGYRNVQCSLLSLLCTFAVKMWMEPLDKDKYMIQNMIHYFHFANVNPYLPFQNLNGA